MREEEEEPHYMFVFVGWRTVTFRTLYSTVNLYRFCERWPELYRFLRELWPEWCSSMNPKVPELGISVFGAGQRASQSWSNGHSLTIQLTKLSCDDLDLQTVNNNDVVVTWTVK